jgi:hypothetical protein
LDEGMTSKDAEAADPRIRWLKAVVIGLGVIFVGLAGGYKRSAPAAAPSSTAEAVQDFGITLPRNSRVAEVLATNNRIVLRVRLADGTERLYALDGESLRLLGSVTIQVER